MMQAIIMWMAHLHRFRMKQRLLKCRLPRYKLFTDIFFGLQQFNFSKLQVGHWILQVGILQLQVGFLHSQHFFLQHVTLIWLLD